MSSIKWQALSTLYRLADFRMFVAMDTGRRHWNILGRGPDGCFVGWYSDAKSMRRVVTDLDPDAIEWKLVAHFAKS